ncbi:large ribosomal subunit protein bL28m [Hydra vulgaris]|uniref:Large ribosomal subunit protein bL28m n=1 Tax=Hydra vulgaris TaxID=6087 RepID=T2MDS9_HYDVU|nr:39S ribosomal protein L28, mitochondrial isoform X1 [Hydra vulgaris]XP_047135198.1 39S ribosomal protein L28, mitochondrial isoform X1 [Hydra vulgaris]
MVKLGVFFLSLARRKKLIGLETRKSYISPKNNEGIWHGAGVKSGFIETFSKKKTKRFWKPNVFEREYHSDLLNETVCYTFTMKAVRAIDYAGGFDNYILRTPDNVLVSNAAIALKRKMETVQRMLQAGYKTLDEIKEEIKPQRISKHVWNPPNFVNRFYFEWRGPRKHAIYC